MNSRRAQSKRRSAIARCEHCQQGLAFGEVVGCFAQRGRLTYPRATPDGRREETAYDWLCGDCRTRADEHRRRGKVSPGAVNLRTNDSLFSKAVIFSTGLATGILVMGIVDRTRHVAPMPGQAASSVPDSGQAGLPVEPPPASSRSGTNQVSKPRVAEKQPSEKVGQEHPPVATTPAPKPSKPSIVVDNLRPQLGRGIRITLRLPIEVAATAPPYLKLKDARGGAYRSEMQAGQDTGEWFWASGLDVPGVWRGEAYVQAGERQLTVPLPRINVSP